MIDRPHCTHTCTEYKYEVTDSEVSTYIELMDRRPAKGEDGNAVAKIFQGLSIWYG